jgi:integrase
VSEYLNDWMEGATRRLRDSSKRSYFDALRPAHERLGSIPMQKVTKADIERMVTWMETAGRRRGVSGGKPGTGLGPRSVQLTLDRLTAVRDGRFGGSNPPKRRQAGQAAEVRTGGAGHLVQAEVRKFLAKAKTDRLHAAWRLSLYGLRRGEVLGLRWTEDVDFGSFANPCKTHAERWCVECYGSGSKYRPASMHIQQARVLVEGKVIITPPKSRNRFRKLPLDAALASALRI